MRQGTRRLGAPLAMALLAGCGGSGATRSTLDRLEAEARAVAQVKGCEKVEQCRAAPVGSKACGGPREYLVYCSVTTDEEALLGQLDQLRLAEEEYNREHNVVSDCKFVGPPPLSLSGGECRAATSP